MRRLKKEETMKNVATTIGAPLAGLALLLTGCSGADSGTPSPQPPIAPTQAQPTAPASPGASAEPTQPAQTSEAPNNMASGPAEDADLATATEFISAEKAVEAATAEAPGTVHNLELEYSAFHKAWIYKVEIQDGGTDHEFDLDATSGAVLKKDTDSEDGTEKAIDLTVMNPAAAMKVAQTLKAGTVSEWKLDWDDNALVYEVNIREGGDTVEVRVDTATAQATLDD